MSTLKCQFLDDCEIEACGHYDAEFWSGPAISIDVCRRHLCTLLLAAANHLPYGEGPSLAIWFLFTAADMAAWRDE